jgi:hypothetical protein
MQQERTFPMPSSHVIPSLFFSVAFVFCAFALPVAAPDYAAGILVPMAAAALFFKFRPIESL